MKLLILLLFGFSINAAKEVNLYAPTKDQKTAVLAVLDMLGIRVRLADRLAVAITVDHENKHRVLADLKVIEERLNENIKLQDAWEI
jgi:hypothetical protein